VLCAVNCIADRVSFASRQPTERQRIGKQVDSAMIFARADFKRMAN